MINSQSKFEVYKGDYGTSVINMLEIVSETFCSFEIILYFHGYWHKFVDRGLQRLLKVKFGGMGS